MWKLSKAALFVLLTTSFSQSKFLKEPLVGQDEVEDFDWFGKEAPKYKSDFFFVTLFEHPTTGSLVLKNPLDKFLLLPSLTHNKPAVFG